MDNEEEDLGKYLKWLQNPDSSVQVHKQALENIRHIITNHKNSMRLNSILKPLKFLQPHYGTLRHAYKSMADSENKKLLKDILSVLALTMSGVKVQESLAWSSDAWVLDYVKDMTAVISEISASSVKVEEDVEDDYDDLMELVHRLLAFHMQRNAEKEAVDLSVEVKGFHLLVDVTEQPNLEKTCAYLLNLAKKLLGTSDFSLLDTAFEIYVKFADFQRAFQIALYQKPYDYKMRNLKTIFSKVKDISLKKQFCFILARHGIYFQLNEAMCGDDKLREDLNRITHNVYLRNAYLKLARALYLMVPQYYQDICEVPFPGKASIVDGEINFDVDRKKLASAFVNSLVNAGFLWDGGLSMNSSLCDMVCHAKTSAVASIGLLVLWWVDSKPSELYNRLESADGSVVDGALIGIGIMNCRVWNEKDPPLPLLAKYIRNNSYIPRDIPQQPTPKIGAIMGLALAYAGSQNEEIKGLLIPIVRGKGGASHDLIAFAGLSLGLVYLGSCNKQISRAITHALMHAEFKHHLTRLLPLALGLLFLGQQELATDAFDKLYSLRKEVRKYCEITLLSCAYAGTGNVLKIQEFVGQCTRRKEESFHGSAVMGIALVAMSQDLDFEMAVRYLDHLLLDGNSNARKAVPLALGLLCVSNPKVDIIAKLGKLTRNQDSLIAMGAIISLGLVAAGTKNILVSKKLHALSNYYRKQSRFLFCVQISQGLLNLGKGLLTLSPSHSNGLLWSPPALAGLLTTLHGFLDMETFFFGEYSFVLFFLVLAMQPKLLCTFNEDLKVIKAAVEVIDKDAKPKDGMSMTPILLSAGERPNWRPPKLDIAR
ncbi:OLC1v1002391C1 [Oldenlandia corymbosa var. corymbosa]|uniref:OLC1v1002391C1 n=1 Tax=Oldenlandia corymbosa var. corymbosa TaxID=529605 RepID=A0AAV1D862_OLDCO|nr:OLC1v1002391C1 [Oldenlandia corymbosa var. corymbosa]